METFSAGVLIILGILAFLNLRNGTLPAWLKAKTFNSAAPKPPSSSSGGGSSGGLPGLGSLFDLLPGNIPGNLNNLGDAFGNVFSSASIGGAGGWIDPLPNSGVSQPYGGPNGHPGVDLTYAGVSGAEVYAARAGTVSFAGPSGGYGLRVDIDHGGGVTTRYGHLGSIGVHVGQQVLAGAGLGTVDTTGDATGPHLHFEVRQDGATTDPCLVVPAMCSTVSA